MNFSTLLRLEVQRIVGDQDGGIGAPLDFDGAAHVGEGAAAGADVVVRFVGFQVLIFVVEDDVAAGDGFVGLVVVFDVVGLQALVAVVNVHGAVGDGEVALALLRAGWRKARRLRPSRTACELAGRGVGRVPKSASRSQKRRGAPSEENASEARGNFGHWEWRFTLNIQSVTHQ